MQLGAEKATNSTPYACVCVCVCVCVCACVLLLGCIGIVTEEVKTTFKNFRNGKYMLNEVRALLARVMLPPKTDAPRLHSLGMGACGMRALACAVWSRGGA